MQTGSGSAFMTEVEQDAVQRQTKAAEDRRKMTERYHMAVVRGRHPRSFPRNSALWVHANQSKARSVRLCRGQSLASVVGGDPSIFSSLSFQGSSSYSALPGHEDPSYHPQHSAWSSQQGGSLDLDAPPGTAGMGMFPPVGTAPGTQESHYDTTLGGSAVVGKDRRTADELNNDQRVSKFQLGRRMSIHRMEANKVLPVGVLGLEPGKIIKNRARRRGFSIAEGAHAGKRIGSTMRAVEATRASAKAHHSGDRRSSKGSSRSVSPADAVALVHHRQNTAGSHASHGAMGGRQHTASSSASSAGTRHTNSSRNHRAGGRAMGLGANLSGITMSTGKEIVDGMFGMRCWWCVLEADSSFLLSCCCCGGCCVGSRPNQQRASQ